MNDVIWLVVVIRTAFEAYISEKHVAVTLARMMYAWVQRNRYKNRHHSGEGAGGAVRALMTYLHRPQRAKMSLYCYLESQQALPPQKNILRVCIGK